MHSYKLTRRGKIVLTMFVMILSLTGSLCLRGIAIASDGSEVVLNNALHLSNINDTVEYISFSNELKRLSENAVKETLINDDSIDDIKEEFLSIDVEDINDYEKKIAFLTFDDGPSQNVTPLILKILKEYNVKATFFVLGNMCEKNGSILKDLKENGHSIGIHSYSHELNKLLKSKDDFINEIKRTEDIIKNNLGEDFSTRLFRFPGGSFEVYKQQYMNDLHVAGYVSVDWNALTGDTEYKKPEPEILMERLKATTKNKDRVIVLMHDAFSKEVTAEILPEVIEYLKFEGYEFAVLK